jgi:hypothetical protein
MIISLPIRKSTEQDNQFRYTESMETVSSIYGVANAFLFEHS